MYVCVCRSVTDRQIRGQVEEGARSMRELATTLGVGTQCGRCGRCARQLLKEMVNGKEAPSAAG